MKIRKNLVSNSSSTSFIIHLSKNTEIEIPNDDEKLIAAIKTLKNGFSVHQEDFGYDVFENLTELIASFVITTHDYGSDGDGYIQNISKERMDSVLEKNRKKDRNED